MLTQHPSDVIRPVDAGWVDEILLAGPAGQTCLRTPEPVDRATLRRMVSDRRAKLTDGGLRRGGAVALRLPPSLAFVANLLAVWQLGGQAILLDHRLTDWEVHSAIQRLNPQIIVSPTRVSGGLRLFHDVRETLSRYGDQPAETKHAVVQLSSGSAGPAKIIGRTAADLIAEIRRYTMIDGVALPGERIVLLPSMVQVVGLVAGLLYGLHAGAELVPPQRLTGPSVLAAIENGSSPATVLGVPHHLSLLNAISFDQRPPMLRRVITGGELVAPAVAAAFLRKYQVPLGNMYGMTEVGVIATDLSGMQRPALRPAHGISVATVDGELWIERDTSPYLGRPVPDRWSDGWLRTKDAGDVSPDTGLVTILGRLDSQVTIDGLQVDLAEVEATISELPGVRSAVVVFDREIIAYLQLADSYDLGDVEAELTARLASYKQPTSYRLLEEMPRTTSGKLIRNLGVLRSNAF